MHNKKLSVSRKYSSLALRLFLIAGMLFVLFPAWQIAAADNKSGSVLQPAAGGTFYKISVRLDGIYQVNYADLQSAGVPVNSLDPRTFQLSNQGVEAAIYVEGEVDGVFASGEYILFYGQKLDTKYTDTNVYWLTWGGANGKRMGVINGPPSGLAAVPANFLTTKHIEDGNSTYQTLRPSGANNDHWYWDYVKTTGAGSSAFKDFSTSLNNIAAGAPTATARGLLKGHASYPQHHTQVSLNGNLIYETTFLSGADLVFNASIPQSYLVNGANKFTVKVLLDTGQAEDIVLINWFELDYYDTYVAENDQLFFDGDQAGTWNYQVSNFSTNTVEAYDITDPANPLQVQTGAPQPGGGAYLFSFDHTITAEHHYLAQTIARRLAPLSIILDQPSDLRNLNNGADWIAITHADFSNSLTPLVNFRAAQGYRVAKIDVQDIYDEFSSGVFDPNAIKSFLAYAYASWTSPAPKYVVLVGDGHYDFRNYMGYNKPNFIPPYLADVDPFMGETAADNRYVTLVGNDILADMHLGRFPVRTAAEADAMVNKILYYEQNPPTSGWNQKLSFAADNADSAGDFAALSDSIANNYVPPPYTVAEKLYLGLNGATTASVQSGIVDAINQGRLLVSYVGHASTGWWAQEKLLQITSISSLTNSDRFPFMVPMTCLEGYYVHPYDSGQSLSESLVRAAGVGAVASWAPTGQGIAHGHDILERGLFLAIFTNKIYDLGSATTWAKQYLYNNTTAYRDLIDTYVLFGDPAMKLQMVPGPTAVNLASFTAVYLGQPGVQLKWETLSETRTAGYNLYRSTGAEDRSAAEENRIRLNTSLIPSQAPGSLDGAKYTYLDGTADPGRHYEYWLETVYIDGSAEYSAVTNVATQFMIYLPLSQR